MLAAFLIVPPLPRLRLCTRHLPGFTVELPLEEETIADTSDYAAGIVILANPGTFRGGLQIAWSGAQLPSDPAEQRAYLRGLTAGLEALGGISTQPKNFAPITHPKMKGVETSSFRYDLDVYHVWVTIMPCGSRQLVLTSTFIDPAGERLHFRIADTLRCQIDPALDDSVGDIPIAMAPPAGWKPVSMESKEGLAFTDETAILYVRRFSIPNPSDETIRKMISLFPWTNILVGPRQGDEWALTVNADGEVMKGWIRVVTCEPHPGALLILLGDPDSSMNDGEQAMRAARCR